MKPLRELTAQDLLRVPVWRYFGDADAAANVEPTPADILTENTTDVFLVRTTFHLNDGSTLVGFCSPQDASGLDYTQPVIVYGSEHVPLFYESAPQKPEPDALCRKLGRKEEDVFPLLLRAEVPVDGKFYEEIVRYVHMPDSAH